MTTLTEQIKTQRGYRILKFRIYKFRRFMRRISDHVSEHDTIMSVAFFAAGAAIVIALQSFIPQTSYAAGTGMNNAPAPRREADVPRQHMVPVVMGGVGDQELDAIKKAERHFSLKLLFTSMKGMYLSNADVLLEDKRGNVYVNDKVDGPMLLADLEPGSYRLTAQYDGKVQVKDITIQPKKNSVVQIRFAIEEDEQHANAATARDSSVAMPVKAGWPSQGQSGGLCMTKANYQLTQNANSCVIQ